MFCLALAPGSEAARVAPDGVRSCKTGHELDGAAAGMCQGFWRVSFDTGRVIAEHFKAGAHMMRNFAADWRYGVQAHG